MTATPDTCNRCGAPWPGPICKRCGLRANPSEILRWSGGPARLPTPVAVISPYQRLYLPREGPNMNARAPVNVPNDAWNDPHQSGSSEPTLGVSGWTMSPTRSGTPNPTGPLCLATDLPGDPAGETILLVQYVSAPIQAGTIAGTAKGQMRFVQDTPSSALHDRVTISLRVVSLDGQTTRGHLLVLGFYGTTNLYADSVSAPENRFLANGDALTPVTAQHGDRLVLEIGSQASTQPQGSALFVCCYSGDDQASDLPEDEATTTNLSPWFEITA